jgi:hypothetical protein
MTSIKKEFPNRIEYHNEQGQCHRTDGPAREWKSGTKEWYINGQWHREDGPAIEFADGYKAWYLNGMRHREDGPAIERKDGFKLYFLNDKNYSEQDYYQEVAKIKLKRILEL